MLSKIYNKLFKTYRKTTLLPKGKTIQEQGQGQGYATYSVKKPGALKNNHPIAQKQNPEVAVYNEKGQPIGTTRHPELLKGTCIKPECSNQHCDSLCAKWSGKVEAQGTFTHDLRVIDTVEISNTDLLGQNKKQGFTPYKKAYCITDAKEIKEDVNKTNVFNKSKDMVEKTQKAVQDQNNKHDDEI